MKKLFGLLFLLFFVFFCIKSECPDHIRTIKNEILVYSTQISTYINAENQCATYGGKIVQVPSEDRSLYNQIVEELYLQGLIEVKIYNKTTVYGNPNEKPQQIYDYHKYRADGHSNDKSSLAGYDRPGIGDLSSFRFSQNSSSNKSRKLQVCYTASRDTIGWVCMTWKLNFELYDETNQSDNTIMLYNYYVKEIGVTNKFSLVPIVGSYWMTSNNGGITSIYIKDISIFIGARSDVNQTKWYWSNNTEINNPLFPEPNSSLCQQMTWPLTYNDSINLRPKQCETGMSHYVCRLNFSINVDEVACNATSLNVSWNSLSQLFQDSSNVVGDLQIKLQTGLSTKNFEINLNQSNVILNGLDQRKEYSIDVSLQIKNCPTFNLTASSSGRTGYGIPDPVTSAYVDNTYNQCKIIWKHNTTHSEIQSYEIHMEPDSGNTSVILHDIINGVELQSFQVDFNDFNYNTTLNFSILAITNCQMKSVLQTVNRTCTTPPSPTTANNSETGLLIGIGVGVGVLLILIALLLVYIFRNKNAKSPSTEPNEFETNSCAHIIQPAKQETPFHNSSPIQRYENIEQELTNGEMESSSDDQDATEYEIIKSSIYSISRGKLEEKFTEESLKSFPNFFAQFEKLKELALENETKHDLASDNKKLNRYKNVYSYDHALVPLMCNKYINASFIQGFENSKQFIATQGPKPNTISDFWEMVWFQESHIIVMLCKCMEKNKSKCAAYWPLASSPITFENLILFLQKQQTIDDITKRIIVLKNIESQEERTVVQYQYTGWPDHDVPCTTSSMTKLRHLVNKEHSAMKSNAPIIVHCSAGAGRTGTYIAIDNLINEINQTQHIDAFNAVLNMRRNRKDMVQTLSQYIFIHKVVAESLILPATEIDVDQFPDTIQNKSWIDKHSSKEFPLLSNPVVTSSVSLNSIQSDDESEYANIKLTTRKDEHQVPVFFDEQCRMMDAHFVQIPCLSSTTIVAAEPNSENEILFWEMILQRNIRCVVGLEESYLTLKLKKEGEVVSFKQTKVIVESVEETSSLLHSNITIHSDKTAHHLTHITTKEIEKEKLLNVKSCLEVYEKIKLISDSCLMIHCKDGCRISGQFLTLMMSIEQIKAEDKIDLFRTVKDLKDYRPSLVGNEIDYKTCYKLVDEYMKYCSEITSSSIYQNI